MKINDKIELLKSLPPTVDSQYSSPKSLHYILLNDIVSHE